MPHPAINDFLEALAIYNAGRRRAEPPLIAHVDDIRLTPVPIADFVRRFGEPTLLIDTPTGLLQVWQASSSPIPRRYRVLIALSAHGMTVVYALGPNPGPAKGVAGTAGEVGS